MSEFDKAFILADPKVLSVEAHTEREVEDHVQWSCDYSKENAIEDARIVIGTLHGSTKEAGFTITIGSLFIETGAADTTTDYELALRGSEALETLYDFCRQQASVVVGMLGLNDEFDVPWRAPVAELSVLDGPEDDGHQPDGEGQDVTSASVTGPTKPPPSRGSLAAEGPLP